MMPTVSQSTFAGLKRFVADSKHQLEKAIAAIQTLEAPDSDEGAFSQALADLHVCATVLGSYSEGIVDAIDQFTEELPE